MPNDTILKIYSASQEAVDFVEKYFSKDLEEVKNNKNLSYEYLYFSLLNSLMYITSICNNKILQSCKKAAQENNIEIIDEKNFIVCISHTISFITNVIDMFFEKNHHLISQVPTESFLREERSASQEFEILLNCHPNSSFTKSNIQKKLLFMYFVIVRSRVLIRWTKSVTIAGDIYRLANIFTGSQDDSGSSS